MFTNTTTATTATQNMSHSTTTKTTPTTTPIVRTTTSNALSHTRLWLLALQLMALSAALPAPLQQHTGCGVAALPITSKPIEGTAENLAWQAWLMLPPEQKQLEKSRKVTPKSIFSLPFRDCPPGHQLFQSRCIPTVNINQSELLTQQLLGLIVGSPGAPGADNAYEFDYEDEELSVGGDGELMYGDPQRSSGTAGDDTNTNINNNSNSNSDNTDASGYAESSSGVEDGGVGGVDGSDAQQPPNRDEPLKFNLFEQKYPTSDYEADSVAIEGSGGARPPPLPENLGSAIFNATQFLDAVQGLLQRHAVANVSLNATNSNNVSISFNNNTSFHYNNSGVHHYSSQSNNNTNNNFNTSNNNTELSDLQASSSNISNNLLSTLATGMVAAPPTFAFDDIDAIVLPAAVAASEASRAKQSAAATTAANLEPQRFSLFKDDSAVQLVTTVTGGHKQRQSEPSYKSANAPVALKDAQPDNIAQLLRDDALLPLVQAQAQAQTQTQTQAQAVANTAAAATTTSRTVLPAALALNAAGSGDTWADATIPTPFMLSSTGDSINVDYEATESTTMPNIAATTTARVEKDEHPRSVTQRNGTANAVDSEAQETSFTTTSEPGSTTSFQIDETTVIETADMQSDTLGDTQLLEAILQEQAKQQLSESGAHEQERRVLKKSKVEPVEQATINTIASAIITTTTTKQETEREIKIKTTTPTPINAKIATETSTTKLAETPQTITNTVAAIARATATATKTKTIKATTTPLPSALTATTATATIANKAISEAVSATNDRFRSAAAAIDDVADAKASAVANGNQVVVAVANLNDAQRSGGNLVNAHSNDTNNDKKNNKKNISNVKNFNKNTNDDSNKATVRKPAATTATTATSEINIEQELRMINELVKGKQQLAALKMATGTIKDTPTTTTTTTTTTAVPTIYATTTETAAATKIESRRSIAEVSEVQSVVHGSGGDSGNDRRTNTKVAPIAIAVPPKRTNGKNDADVNSAVTADETPATATARQNNEDENTTNKAVNNEAMTTNTNKNVDIAPSTTTQTTTTTTTTIRSAPKTTTEIAQPSLWTRFVPFFRFGSAAAAKNAKILEKTTTTTTIASNLIPSTTTPTTTTITPQLSIIETFKPSQNPLNQKIAIGTSNGDANNNLSNRSNRNSKIIRINHLNDNGVVLADAETNASAITATTTTTTRTATTTADEQVEQPPSDPFWWLPTGWRLDRQANDDQNLLLRLWSAFPESQLKAKAKA